MKAAQAAVQTALQIQLAAVGIKVFGAICNKNDFPLHASLYRWHCVYVGTLIS